MPPLIHTHHFTIRAYECDAYGHLNNVNYLRFMQEAAFGASRAAGYDFARYRREQLVWLIRDNAITFSQPLHYRDEIEVRTWIHDFRRVRSRRRYEFRRVDDEQLAASASTDWVLVAADTHRPQRIPTEMVAAFAPGGLTEAEDQHPPFPQPPAPPGGAYIHEHRVGFTELDSMQHLNNANYLAIAVAAGSAATRHFGWPVSRLLAMGYAWLARAARIEYRGQPRLDDRLHVTTFLADPRRVGARRYYLFHDAASGEFVAQAYHDWVFIEIETGRPTRIPDALYADFAANIVGN